MSKNGSFTTKSLTACALLVAMQVILARFVAITVSETTRISFEAIPIFLAGLLFGPVAGMLVGFISDFIGAIMSFGFNPIFCIPPILYGLCGGMCHFMIRKKFSFWKLAVAFLPAVVLGSVLWQSFALAKVYGGDAKRAYLITKLTMRGIQFAITYVVDVLIIYALCKSNLFRVIGIWKKN